MATPLVPDSDGSTETVIEGGQVQHDDLTRWDYVPASDQETRPSFRSAWGHEVIGGFDFGYKGLPLKIPAGTLAHDIQGGSTYIRSEAAQYLLFASANICNYRIDFQNRDIHGNIMKTWVGPTQYNCAWRWSMKREINQPFYVSRGKQCARLFVGGAFRGEQCHNIF